MNACNCTMGAWLGRCCQTISTSPTSPYPPNPIVFHPLNSPDGRRIEDLEEQIKQLQKELADLKKKD